MRKGLGRFLLLQRGSSLPTMHVRTRRARKCIPFGVSTIVRADTHDDAVKLHSLSLPRAPHVRSRSSAWWSTLKETRATSVPAGVTQTPPLRAASLRTFTSSFRDAQGCICFDQLWKPQWLLQTPAHKLTLPTRLAMNACGQPAS